MFAAETEWPILEELRKKEASTGTRRQKKETAAMAAEALARQQREEEKANAAKAAGNKPRTQNYLATLLKESSGTETTTMQVLFARKGGEWGGEY